MARASKSLRGILKSPFQRAIAIQQTGARRAFIKTKGGQKVFKLGNAVFTEREVVKGRARFAQTRGVKISGLGKTSLRL